MKTVKSLLFNHSAIFDMLSSDKPHEHSLVLRKKKQQWNKNPRKRRRKYSLALKESHMWFQGWCLHACNISNKWLFQRQLSSLPFWGCVTFPCWEFHSLLVGHSQADLYLAIFGRRYAKWETGPDGCRWCRQLACAAQISPCSVSVFAAPRLWAGQGLRRDNAGSGPVAQCHSASPKMWNLGLCGSCGNANRVFLFHFTLKGRITGSDSKGLFFCPKGRQKAEV